MQHKGFFRRAGPFPLRDLVARTGVTHPDGADLDIGISDIRPLDAAGPADASFFENPKYAAQLAATSAAACFVAAKAASRTPAGCAALISPHPYRSFAEALFLFYPEAGQPLVAPGEASDYVGGVHRTAQVEDGAQIEYGAIVGAEAAIGSGTRVAAGAVVGYRVHVGRDSYIGPNVSLTHALVGDRVTIHAGVSIGQDGFGFAMSGSGHFKVPQIGRVIVQDDVEIGANTTVDRGALRDTIIGEGTKIDNLVQIGHNVVIGRRCVIVAQTGIAGSAVLEDFVVMGGQSGIAGHLKVGAGTQIAGASHVTEDVPPRARMVGTPAVPIREWTRQRVALRRLAGQSGAGAEPDDSEK
jgi:UDP-3-O-[3-hydroxymyristoyl] glucosamine N-acyltransferase